MNTPFKKARTSACALHRYLVVMEGYSLRHARSMAELQVLKRQSQKRDHRIASSVDVSKGQMLLLRPERLRGARVRSPKASLTDPSRAVASCLQRRFPPLLPASCATTREALASNRPQSRLKGGRSPEGRQICGGGG
jgi:hypothetical protein